MKGVLLFAVIFLTTLIGVPNTANAQMGLGTWEGSAYAGLSTYQGDMVEPNFTLKGSEFALGFGVRNFLSPQFALGARLWYLKISGDDSLYPSIEERGGRMLTKIGTVLLVAEYSPFGVAGDPGASRKLSPYIFLGTGVGFVNHNVNYGQINAPEETIKQDEENSKGVYVLFPFGGGLRFAPTNSWNLSLEASLMTPFSDYIDGISALGNPSSKDWVTAIMLGFHMPFGGERMIKPDDDKDQYHPGGF